MTVPNIVLIVMDTARASDTAPLIEADDTGLGRFAANGETFTNATANAPWTLPSHGTLFTGVHPSVHGAHAAHRAFEYEPTVAQLLDDAGYRTLAVSNNTWISDEFGFGRGFGEFVATWQLFQDGVDYSEIARTESGALGQLRGVLRNFSGNPLKNAANLIYGQFFRKRTDDGAARTNELLADRIPRLTDGEQPFFCFVNYLEPHLEYRPPERLQKKQLPEDVSVTEAMAVNQDAWAYITGETDMSERDFEILRALYRAEVKYLDERLTGLRELFEREGVLDETVFLIVGDHGENIGEHGLMDHQYSLHETLLNVPLIASGPGFRSGRTVEKPVQLADLFPTVLDIAGIEAPEIEHAGQSLCEMEAIPSDRPIFSEYIAPQPPVETLEQRYDCDERISEFDRRLWCIKQNGRKHIRGSDGSTWSFDLTTDHGETSDAAVEQPDAFNRLSERLSEWVVSRPSVRNETVAIDEQTVRRLEELGYLN